MHFSLGIDAGGTYTDAVIIRDSDGEIIDSNKALTTYPDLLQGIKNSLDGLNQEYLNKVKLVSVSTTLATNTILEKTGYSVALILAGDTDVPPNSPIKNWSIVSGGHNSSGAEVAPLDTKAIEEFALKMKEKVSAFAVSSYFSVRNPEHELRIKEIIKEITGLPVVCGHELSQDLGAYERGVTAYLNAQLIPIANQFMGAVISEIEARDIDAKLLMLKCDGSVVGIKEALEKPIESIFSGPAASLVGAAHLSKLDSCAVIDVGGTSTDVSFIYKGLPDISDTGAVVGGWQTKVKAIKMETSATGGDSHVWVRNHKIHIGPRRVIPLCRAATIYPEILEKLSRSHKIQNHQLGENLQPTKFFMRTGLEPADLTSNEKELLDRIKCEPMGINEIYWESNRLPSPMTLDSLVQKRLIKTIGFTPTDALHVLGDYTEWNTEAAIAGAEILEKFAGVDKYELCSYVKNRVAKNMARDVASYIMEGVDKEEISKILEGDFFGNIKIDLPVVLLGGPVGAYAKKLEEIIDAKIILPEYAEVGNAVGALVGKGVKRIEILIRSSFGESHYNLRQTTSTVFSPEGMREFPTHDEAVDYASELGTRLILEYMKEFEIDQSEIKIDMKRSDITVHGNGLPIETRLVFLGVSMSKSNDEI